jgi:hypothetical protein
MNLIASLSLLLIPFWSTLQVVAFSPLVSRPQRQQSACHAVKGNTVGKRMGVAAEPKKGMGMGAPKKGKTSNTTPFDVTAALARSYKRYDEILLAEAKQLSKDNVDSRWAGEESITTEYVIAVRSPSPTKTATSDWVPVAQLCLQRPSTMECSGSDDPLVRASISSLCRELSHVAGKGAPVFQTLPRNDIQYSVEPLDQWNKFVYDGIIGGRENPNETMTKAESRMMLGLATDCNVKSEIKQAYRSLSFQLHSDRFEGTEEECKDAAIRFSRVKLAYETLGSGVRSEGTSWYESIGGRDRNAFVGPVNLLPIEAAKKNLESQKVRSAVQGLNPDLCQSFVARNLRSE